MIESFEAVLRKICETRGLSIPQMCDGAEINYKTFITRLRRGSQMDFTTVDRICHFLNIPHAAFSMFSPHLGVSHEKASDDVERAAAKIIDAAMQTAHMDALRRKSQIGTMDVLDWIRRTGARLEDFEAIQESVDLFHVMGVDDMMPDPYRVGRDSLSTRRFEIETNEEYRAKIAAFHPNLLENIKKGRIEASYRPYMIADVQLRVNIGGKWVTETYCRLTAKVYLPEGRELTLIHAEPVPSSRVAYREATDLDLIQPQANHEVGRQE